MITRQHSKITTRTERGFSLIEVLIALIIMSVGMLGIASLYVHSMQAGRTSLFRHNAVTLAGDVADRMRANPTGANAYTALLGADNDCIDGGTNCSNTQMAAQDILAWQLQADDTLPNGTVTIGFDNTVNPPVYTIAINWNEPMLDPNGQPSYTIITPIPGF